MAVENSFKIQLSDHHMCGLMGWGALLIVVSSTTKSLSKANDTVH